MKRLKWFIIIVKPLTILELLILLFIFFTDSALSQDSLQNFYPFSIGNQWQYTSYSYYGDLFGDVVKNYSIKVITIPGDTTINGKIFFNVGTELLRYGDDNKLYSWHDSTEYLDMDFNLNTGETFQYHGTIATVNEGFTNLFGEDRYYKGFRHGYGTNGYELFSYVDSLGLNYHETSDGWYVFIQGGEISLIDAIIQYNDSVYYYSYHYKPQLVFIPIDTTDTFVVSLNFNVGHTYTKFSTNGTSRNFIKDVWLEYFYSKDDSSTTIDSLICQVSDSSTNCYATILLDSLEVTDGFKYNYAIYARDKALIPEVSRLPESGYYQLEYIREPSGTNEKKNNKYSFALSQNYPNPFNPTTSIQYSVSSRQFVTLKVYDVLGNEIVTLVNEEKPAGSYTVNFDGSKLSSGVYFYQLKAVPVLPGGRQVGRQASPKGGQAGTYTVTKKLILLK